jgi:hypothetical protein
MQSFSTKEKINRLIAKIKTDWDRANAANHGISRIDKDILSDDIKKLYDLIYELDIARGTQHLQNPEKPQIEKNFIVEETGQAQTDIPDDPAGEESPDQEFNLTQEIQQQQTNASIDTVNETEKISTAEPENQVPASAQPPRESGIDGNGSEEIKPEIPKAAVVEENSSLKKLKNTKVTLDLFSASKTLADVYQNDKDNSLAAKIQNNKILDIKTAIGINDKFLFINEIFKGEMSAYNQAIENLNQTNDFSDAIHIIEGLKSIYGSEENQVSFNKLYEIAKRRFH